jgi:adenylate kinase family enzyme
MPSRKVLVFGNSGSGKSTLAKRLAKEEHLAHLDLDTLAWLPGEPPTRTPLESSDKSIKTFLDQHSGWVIEGCYGDLLRLTELFADQVIFMNLSVERCIRNARARPWEPLKYDSLDAQNKNLGMLIDWIKQYPERSDVCSLHNHRDLYEEFSGKKRMITVNEP